LVAIRRAVALALFFAASFIPAGLARAEKTIPADAAPRYSDQIGQVLATVDGLFPRCQLTGKELYVRAVVISSQPPADPSFEGQKFQAWTQPVGWESLEVEGRTGER